MITTTQTTSILISHPLERLFPLAATQQAAGARREIAENLTTGVRDR